VSNDRYSDVILLTLSSFLSTGVKAAEIHLEICECSCIHSTLLFPSGQKPVQNRFSEVMFLALKSVCPLGCYVDFSDFEQFFLC